MHKFILSFLSSAITCFFVIKYLHRIFRDPLEGGPQKFHTRETPRAGGVGVAIGLIATGIMLSFKDIAFSSNYWLLLLSASFIFLGGLLEDITKKIGVRLRMTFQLISAILAAFLLNAFIVRIGIPIIDNLFSFFPFLIIFTCFAVVGISNSINIIDGYNGLAGGVSIIILSVLGYVSFKVGDQFLMTVCLSTSGAILGFLIWNYPFGFIFLGDGGAYLVGFIIAEISVLLVYRHQEVSPWFPMLAVAYPFTESVFSIYRRNFLKNRSSTMPDAMHLHSLIFRRVVKYLVHRDIPNSKLRCNYMTSPYLWLLSAVTAIPALIFWQHTWMLVSFFFTFVVFYIWFYCRIIRFKCPKLLLAPLPVPKKKV